MRNYDSIFRFEQKAILIESAFDQREKGFIYSEFRIEYGSSTSQIKYV